MSDVGALSTNSPPKTSQTGHKTNFESDRIGSDRSDLNQGTDYIARDKSQNLK